MLSQEAAPTATSKATEKVFARGAEIFFSEQGPAERFYKRKIGSTKERSNIII